jgi:hypothetical protein
MNVIQRLRVVKNLSVACIIAEECGVDHVG